MFETTEKRLNLTTKKNAKNASNAKNSAFRCMLKEYLRKSLPFPTPPPGFWNGEEGAPAFGRDRCKTLKVLAAMWTYEETPQSIELFSR